VAAAVGYRSAQALRATVARVLGPERAPGLPD
jgi:hypothetical protein